MNNNVPIRKRLAHSLVRIKIFRDLRTHRESAGAASSSRMGSRRRRPGIQLCRCAAQAANSWGDLRQGWMGWVDAPHQHHHHQGVKSLHPTLTRPSCDITPPPPIPPPSSHHYSPPPALYLCSALLLYQTQSPSPLLPFQTPFIRPTRFTCQSNQFAQYPPPPPRLLPLTSSPISL